MAKRLTITELNSVGGVDAGDNPGASLLFWKRKKHTPEVGDDPVEGVLMDGETVAVEETEDVGKVEADLEVSAEAFEGIVDAIEAAEVEKTADEVIPVEELAKKLAAEEVAKAVAERDAAVAQLAEEVDKRLNQEWVGKAKAYELLLGPACEVGPLFRKIADAAPDAFERLETALAAALNRADLAKILSEVGSDMGEQSDDPIVRRDAFVKKHPELKVEDARALFWETHPEAKIALREGA